MLSSLRSYLKDKKVTSTGRHTLFLLALLLGLTIGEVRAQHTEIGIELGGYNYLGDVVRSYELSNHTIGGQFFVRKHVSKGLSVRLGAGLGKLKGADNEAFDIFSANRRASFDGSFMNVDLLLEYHFLDYRDERLQQFWTPYIMLGAGGYEMKGRDNFGTSYTTGIGLRMPVGLGIKYRIDRRWILGISTLAIKSNSDLIDNVSASSANIKDYRGGNPNDDDWTFFTGISLSYTFYRIVCPQNKFR